MGCAHKENRDGFTLVEISIVMIIIGLLIGGTFGGMKLIENMQVNKTVQDLKAIESAALTFKDTYGRLPGDIVNPAARLPNCTVAPCATGGNGNRAIGTNGVSTPVDAAILATDENFTFWHHLQAADLLSVGTKNTTDMSFGEGQPDSSVGGGFRVTTSNGVYFFAGISPFERTVLYNVGEPSVALPTANTFAISCSQIGSIDRKLDDALVYQGCLKGWGCGAATATAEYVPTSIGAFIYDLKGF